MAPNRAALVFERVARAAAARHESVSNAVLCEVACALLGADSASVALMAAADEGEPPPRVRQEPLAAAGGGSLRVEELQLATGEGPSLAAFTQQQPVLVPDLAATAQWPGFASAAGQQHVAAMFAFPLHAAGSCAGVFTAHRMKRGALSSPQLADAHHLAALSDWLLLTGAGDLAAVRGRDGPAAERDEVHQATGMLAVQLGVGLGAAFDRLRGHAFVADLALAEVAHAVVERRLVLDSDINRDP